ncbi:bifunctional phosphoglucose/phosphomannose isomerase [Candidatus Saccharibacteria bacterium]|nr:bifunctional phosphoglucose/phosphomannose isomerase [Candidatus Saccharibacteria bacterium]MBI2285385.1 bifunctional phosphoglucose/phosphomannose isomerase [Candidatus Saccharibacteria bacterium]
MLDDLKYIHQRDGQDALGIAEKQWQQLEHQFEFTDGRLRVTNIANVVYAGMGGSALAALISKSWPGCKTAFEVCRQYKIPSYVSSSTLFIASSYSGNTEETVAALAEAEEKGATIVVITGGGKLQEIASQKKYPLLLLPDTGQPRYAVMANLKALVVILETANLLNQPGAGEEMQNAVGFLQFATKVWLPTVPTSQNPAKKLALELAGKSPVIYAGSLLVPAAYKWKINFNENAKNLAWWNELPEFDHNELIGWSSHPMQKPYEIIELRSKLEHPRVQKRFEAGEKLLSGLRPAPNVVEVQGETLLEQLLWAINFGDFVSIYLALLNNVNPTPVDLVEKFKKELG